MGLWIINECRREWKKQQEISFNEIVEAAKSISENKYIIDVDDDIFYKPDDMPEKVRRYCLDRYGSAPSGIGETARCVYESLCVKYREVIGILSEITKKTYDKIYVVGGGCKAEYLCQSIASFCGIKVYAGPVEATAIGNALVQLIALNALKNDDSLKELIRKSFDVRLYTP